MRASARPACREFCIVLEFSRWMRTFVEGGVSFRLRPTAGAVYRDIYVARYCGLNKETIPNPIVRCRRSGATGASHRGSGVTRGE